MWLKYEMTLEHDLTKKWTCLLKGLKIKCRCTSVTRFFLFIYSLLNFLNNRSLVNILECLILNKNAKKLHKVQKITPSTEKLLVTSSIQYILQSCQCKKQSPGGLVWHAP